MIDGQPIIELPPKTIHLSKVEFSSEERAFYTKLEADSRTKFKVHSVIYLFILLEVVQSDCYVLYSSSLFLKKYSSSLFLKRYSSHFSFESF